MLRFSAEICKIGINPVVDPPDDVLVGLLEQAGRSKGAIPVRGRLNGAEFVQTLVKYKGLWQLYINGPMLRATGLGVGDIADIEIEVDPQPREVPVPRLFAEALENDAIANAEFQKLTPSRQKEILRYLGHLKTEESLRRNVEKLIRQLTGIPVDNPHIAIRSNRDRDSA